MRAFSLSVQLTSLGDNKGHNNTTLESEFANDAALK